METGVANSLLGTHTHVNEMSDRMSTFSVTQQNITDLRRDFSDRMNAMEKRILKKMDERDDKLKQYISDVRTELKTDVAELKTDVAALKDAVFDILDILKKKGGKSRA